MNIEDKFNLDDIYIAETPGPYMQFSLEKEYFMPEFGVKYFQSLLEKLHESLQHPVNVMDLGASYGILSTLILKGISWQNLIDFYVTDGKINYDLWEEIKDFYKGLVHNDNKYKFYLVDSSPAAMQFANNVRVCEQAFTFNLLESTLTKELEELIKQIDIFTIAGAINYLGTNFLKQMLEVNKKINRTPLIAFSTYLILYEGVSSVNLEKLLAEYDYRILRGQKSGIGRRASSKEHKIILEEGRYKEYSLCKFEESGFFSAVFYLAVHKSQYEEFSVWLQDLEDK